MNNKGDTLCAWQEFEDGNWLIIGVYAEGGQPVPLVHRDQATAELWRPIAKMHHNDTGNPIRLAAFHLVKTLEAQS